MPSTEQSAATRDPVGPIVFLASAAWLMWWCRPDVHVGDSGELGAAAQALGVAHPTGFPVDMLLQHAASLVPFGSIAFRQNALVALVAGFALGMLADLVVELCGRAGIGDEVSRRAGAVLGASLLLGSVTFLEAALAVEVYATSLLVVLWGARTLLRSGAGQNAVWVLVGLSCGVHVTAGLLLLPLAVVAATGASAMSARSAVLRVALSVVVAALVIAYLPMASLREPALDWGDAQTLPRLLAHLTAARIRSAYAGEMFADQAAPAVMLLTQLLECGVAAMLGAGLGLAALMWRARPDALAAAALLSVDIAYAVWVNPMGIAARQLGHASLAVLALLSAVGLVAALGWLSRVRSLQWAVGVGAVLLGVGSARAAMPRDREEGYVVGERYGSGGPLRALPPRAVLVCANDVACSAALFAVYAERTRPDVAVIPEQHLWDPTVLRRLDGLPVARSALAAAQDVPVPLRAALAERVLRDLASAPELRPLRFEHPRGVRKSARELSGLRVGPSEQAPFAMMLSEASQVPTSVAMQRVNAYVAARFGRQGPRSQAARDAWFDAYEVIGESAITAYDNAGAVAALRKALELSPRRAVGHSNLGVALERLGDLPGALSAMHRAIELEPTRATAWVNAARLVGRMQGVDAARKVAAAAQAAGVQDARLSALLAQGSTEK